MSELQAFTNGTRTWACYDCGKCTATCPISRAGADYSPRRHVLAANSGMELYDMTETYHRGIPQWARFKGDEIVEQGYFDREGFVIDLVE